ncbi:hypothetical protein ACT3SZ_07345 [Corynebacterium sp. AOP40-9SA-29]|uniref:hypothetical protein n=1 Tax=Corynebacterium sp. AOP40-9SA-29 TaxID=3457677 RepID=UPI004034AD9E
MNIFHRNATKAAAAAFIAVLAITGASTATAAPKPDELAVTWIASMNAEDDRYLSTVHSLGTTFYIRLTVLNTSDTPITVTGYNSALTTVVHPAWIERGYEPQYCDQYIVESGSTERQSFPQVVDPGESVYLKDNVNYERLDIYDEACQLEHTVSIGTLTVAGDNDDLPPSSSSSSHSSLTGSLGSLISN